LLWTGLVGTRVENQRVFDIAFAKLQASARNAEVGIDLMISTYETGLLLLQQLANASMIVAAGFELDNGMLHATNLTAAPNLVF
jgi:hypothetical protein